MSKRLPAHIAAAAAVILSATALAPSAHAADATATLTGGTLTFLNSTPGNVAFPGVTLDGTNQTVDQAQTIDVQDARGNGSGWNITATSTTFTSGTDTLPVAATTIQAAPTAACIGGSTCTVPSGGAVAYPYTLPADTVAPTATKMFAAATSTGLGQSRLSSTWRLAVPASARAGNYTSTWTFSLVSGP